MAPKSLRIVLKMHFEWLKTNLIRSKVNFSTSVQLLFYIRTKKRGELHEIGQNFGAVIFFASSGKGCTFHML
jgi:hypothetical protein